MKNNNQHLPTGNLDRPRMLVTQAEYDAASPETRAQLNYAVHEGPMTEPPQWVCPVSDPEDDLYHTAHH